MPLDGFRLSPAADADLAEIWEYTAATWSEPQAEKYNADLFGCFRMLVQHPKSGRVYSDLSVPLRVIVCNRHIVVYRIVEHEVVIVNVLNSRRNWVDILFSE